MLHGKRIEHCPFIPFVIPHAKSVNYHKISKILQFEDQKPHLIFLANSTFEEPPYVEYVEIHILYFCDYKKPKSTYFDFLDLSYEIIANSQDNKIPFIGIASRSTPDFCEFFIARWLINECGYSTNEVLNLVRQSLQPGIVKQKFLRQLSKLNFRFEKPIKTENPVEQNINQEETIQIPVKTESENEKAEIQIISDQQSIIPSNSPEIHQNYEIKEEKIQKNESPIPIQQPSTVIPERMDDREQQQQQQIQMQIEESRIPDQNIQQQQQIIESLPSSDIYQQQQQQIQLQMQQRKQQQIQLQQLQAQAQTYYQYQNQVKQFLQDFQARPYDYQQQHQGYQYQLQKNLQESSITLQSIEHQIQQIQASQQVQQQQIQQQQQQIIPNQIINSNSVQMIHSDSFSVDKEKIIKSEDSSASINASGSGVITQNQLQQIEIPISIQHANMYFNEIEKKMNVPQKKCLFTEFAPITQSQLKIISNRMRMNKKEVYCLMPEPDGIRALLYLRGKFPILIFQNYSPIQLKLEINTNDDDFYIFEVILIRYAQSNFVLCDVMYAKDEDVSCQPFNYRIGIIKNCYDNIFQPLNSSLLKFTIRPFYRLKDYNILTDLFEKRPRKKFTKYPLLGISATLLNSGNCHSSKCMFLWTKDVIENPRVIIEIDFGDRNVFGFAQNGTTSAIIAYLGKLSPEMFDLNGKVVEIEILDQDPDWKNLLNAQIIKLSDDDPWTTDQFKEYYPEREPHMDIRGLSSMLETLASIS